ncbi:MAG: hypothetical protein ACLSFB_06500 [[Clostridium] scindens]
MELIQTDILGREEGYVLKANIDFEVGEDEKDSINDFEVEFKRYYWTGNITYGCRMFSPNTEFGGIVREISTDTRANTVIVNGYTWRGMLAKKDYYSGTGAGLCQSVRRNKQHHKVNGGSRISRDVLRS